MTIRGAFARGTFARGTLAALAIVLGAGCAATRSRDVAFDPPAVPVVLTHHSGTPWSGPLPGGPGRDAVPLSSAAGALGLRCRVGVVEGDDAFTESLTSISARARLLLETSGADPILGAAGVAEDVLEGRGGAAIFEAEDAPRRGALAEVVTVVPPGVTARVMTEMADRFDVESPAHPFLRFGLAACRTGDGLSLVADIERLAARGTLELTPDPLAPPPETAPARVLVDFEALLVPGGEAILLCAPAPFGPHRSARLVIVAEAIAASEVSDAALERTLRDVRAADRDEALRGAVSTLARFRANVAAGALQAMADPEARRSVIVLLADACGSTLGADVAMASEAAGLERFAAALATELDAGGAPVLVPGEGDGDVESVGWVFERATYRFLASLREEFALSPALLSVLARHAGEAARFPATLVEIANAASGPEDMEARLIEENAVRLDDSSESVRVRAYDWLDRRGRAPAGYDPLASREERREVLRRLASEEAERRAAPPAESRP